MRVQINGEPHEFTGPSTVAEVLAELDTPGTGSAIAVDGEVVPRTNWTSTPVSDGARIEIMTAVQGG